MARLMAGAACALLLLPFDGHAARISDVRNTVHNLSTSNPVSGAVKATSESEVCVFCHTPHGADTSQTPLWNKTLAAKTYTVYTSKSLDAETIRGGSLEQPMGSSKLCLSCHDGAMALGSVRVLRGVNNPAAISLQDSGGAVTTMPTGSGANTGYTRQLGNLGGKQPGEYDLTNDHPISVTYDATLAARDGELRVPDSNQQSTILIGGSNPLFGKRSAGNSASRPVLPLEPTGASSAGQIQCTTCHDPHIRETDTTAELNIKFLRRPRFQLDQATTNPQNYNDGNDIICLACHDKGLQGAGGGTWVYSAHANENVATQVYRGAAAGTRQFPTGIPVWKASCLNCHDTHTVTGSRRLLREGTDATPATALYLGGFKAGGSTAIEETCYQCHRDAANSILQDSTSVPNIRDDFQSTFHMPIASADQSASGAEVHDPGSGTGGFNDGYAGGMVNSQNTTGSNCAAGSNTRCGADLIESRELLGTTANNRHVECTDCHNPHRVVKFKLFFGNGGNLSGAGDTQGGTHEHTDTAMTHTNVASGVLRGTWGVEPTYSSNSFHASASGYIVRRGDPGSETISTAMPLNNAGGTIGGTTFNAMDNVGFVTREYQVCLKCHSTYGYTSPPNLRTTSPRGLTTASAGYTTAQLGIGNGMTQYTDQAKEFQAPDSHANESTASTAVNLGTDGGAIGYNNNNHRSWHPVMRSTGRTAAKRALTASSAWRAPWSNSVGTQTMYCSDCHGSNVSSQTSVIPDSTNTATGAGSPWGPHGSTNKFILKGTWDHETNINTTTALCLKCHRPTNGDSASGFCCLSGKNLHTHHNDKTGPIECTWCHVAVPHGWKNKAFLVNLNDVGEEAGQGTGASKEVSIDVSTDYYTRGPYYLQAKNKIVSFARAGQWAEGNCGSAGKAGTGLTTGRINSTNGQTANATGSGKNWMTNMCQNPP